MELVKGLAGPGNSEFIGDDEDVDDKVMAQLNRALLPEWSNVTASFQGNANMQQFPKIIPSLSTNDRISLFVNFSELKVQRIFLEFS
jgi:hypothetical protein